MKACRWKVSTQLSAFFLPSSENVKIFNSQVGVVLNLKESSDGEPMNPSIFIVIKREKLNIVLVPNSLLFPVVLTSFPAIIRSPVCLVEMFCRQSGSSTLSLSSKLSPRWLQCICVCMHRHTCHGFYLYFIVMEQMFRFPDLLPPSERKGTI